MGQASTSLASEQPASPGTLMVNQLTAATTNIAAVVPIYTGTVLDFTPLKRSGLALTRDPDQQEFALVLYPPLPIFLGGNYGVDVDLTVVGTFANADLVLVLTGRDGANQQILLSLVRANVGLTDGREQTSKLMISRRYRIENRSTFEPRLIVRSKLPVTIRSVEGSFTFSQQVA